MAITVNHYANGKWSVTGIALDRNILANSLYHYGELKPNYPVPAIRQRHEYRWALVKWCSKGFHPETYQLQLQIKIGSRNRIKVLRYRSNIEMVLMYGLPWGYRGTKTI